MILHQTFSNLPNKKDAVGLGIQARVIGPSRPSETPIKKLNEDKMKRDELAKYASHFEYISTMASFNDSFFKSSIRKDLLKDRHASWNAFKSLSPQLVWWLAGFCFNANLIASNMHLQLIGTSSHRLFLVIIHTRPKPSGIWIRYTRSLKGVIGL